MGPRAQATANFAQRLAKPIRAFPLLMWLDGAGQSGMVEGRSRPTVQRHPEVPVVPLVVSSFLRRGGQPATKSPPPLSGATSMPMPTTKQMEHADHRC